jgi:quercetin dioxygenase-like cupin family protein
MNKLIVPAIIVAAGMAVAGAWSQTAQAPKFQVTRYFQTPLEGDAKREVRLQSVVLPVGAANEFHRHNGDQWAAVQEGEVTFTIQGEAPRVLKAGDWVYIPRGTVHRNQNLADKPARSVELNIMDKDKPVTEEVAAK